MAAQWRKSSYSSGGTSAQCIELANLGPVVGIRDSKAPESGHLTVGRSALAKLVRQIKAS